MPSFVALSRTALLQVFPFWKHSPVIHSSIGVSRAFKNWLHQLPVVSADFAFIHSDTIKDDHVAAVCPYFSDTDHHLLRWPDLGLYILRQHPQEHIHVDDVLHLHERLHFLR